VKTPKRFPTKERLSKKEILGRIWPFKKGRKELSGKSPKIGITPNKSGKFKVQELSKRETRKFKKRNPNFFRPLPLPFKGEKIPKKGLRIRRA